MVRLESCFAIAPVFLSLAQNENSAPIARGHPPAIQSLLNASLRIYLKPINLAVDALAASKMAFFT